MHQPYQPMNMTEEDLFSAKSFVTNNLIPPFWYTQVVASYDEKGYLTLKSFFSELSDTNLRAIGEAIEASKSTNKYFKYLNIIVGLTMVSEGVDFTTGELDRCFAIWIKLFIKELRMSYNGLREEILRTNQEYTY